MSDPGGIMINKEHANHVVYLKLNRYFISLTLIDQEFFFTSFKK